jgi:S-adenosylmethionine synthetase
LVISSLDARDDVVEIVERKGLGHPDTICDALAETLSRNLCREYRNRFGTVLHHNVDKALLRGGRSAPAFGGGDIIEPISIYLAGRATTEVAGQAVPIREIAVEGSRAWLRDNLHALDPERNVHIHDLTRPGSQDLQELFSRQSRPGVALANDTAIGVGYAPLSALERLVLSLEKRINGRDRSREHPAWGEDVKVMGVRRGDTVHLTVVCAMIGRYLAHMDAYLAEKSALASMAQDLAMECGFPACDVSINAADDPRTNAIYLTVTGTSAEAGDDGQVGRGNRVNGLITPGRPMVLGGGQEPRHPRCLQHSRPRDRRDPDCRDAGNRSCALHDRESNWRACHRAGDCAYQDRDARRLPDRSPDASGLGHCRRWSASRPKAGGRLHRGHD